MKLTFNTLIGDGSIALRAIRNYRAGAYKDAVVDLQSVLDLEPQNWNARLMLGACYFRMEQWFAAQSAFQFINDKSNEPDMRSRALEGLNAVSTKVNKRTVAQFPAEFGNFVDHYKTHPPQLPVWL
jgi:tetratricopeptide (TPR) repeat protein